MNTLTPAQEIRHLKKSIPKLRGNRYKVARMYNNGEVLKDAVTAIDYQINKAIRRYCELTGLPERTV